jgi:hypothetical protein
LQILPLIELGEIIVSEVLHAYIVYGHTHNPHVYLHEANPGSWVSDSRIQNTLLTIEEGEVIMNYWPDYRYPVNPVPAEVVSCV